MMGKRFLSFKWDLCSRGLGSWWVFLGRWARYSNGTGLGAAGLVSEVGGGCGEI